MDRWLKFNYYFKVESCNSRRFQGRSWTRGLKFVLKGHLSVFYLYSTWITRFWDFFLEFPKSRFGHRDPGSNFKSYSDTPKLISDCSNRWTESIGANISRIRSSYHKLWLKAVQKCQKAWIVRKNAFFCSYRYEQSLWTIAKIIFNIVAKQWY